MRSEILAAASAFNFEVLERDSIIRLGRPCSPLTILFEETPDGDTFMCLGCQASRFLWNQDRTDLNDVFSWLIGAFLRRAKIASSHFIDLDHPVVPGELYGRYIFLDQSTGTLLRDTEAGKKAIWSTLTSCTLFEQFAHEEFTFWHPESMPMQDQIFDTPEIREWSDKIVHALGSEIASPEDLYARRMSTGWRFYRTANETISVAQSPALTAALQRFTPDEKEEIPGINGYLYTDQEIGNFISSSERKIAEKIFEALQNEAGSTLKSDPLKVIPMENMALFYRGDTTLCLRGDFGVDGFKEERALILERNRREQELLFPPSGFEWNAKIDGGRFEELVYDLLSVEPDVAEVRSVGATRERDGGRDMLARWITPLPRGVKGQEEKVPGRERKVIVQCKSRQKSVGRADLDQGVLDTLFMYGADGYFLAVSSQLAVSAIDLLERLRERSDHFVTWWGRVEIEQRLRKNPEILRRHQDIVRPL
ncbi:restriction endonuclease [Streptomyces griseoincarnatus]